MAGPVFTVSGSPKENVGEHETLIAWTEFLSTAPKDHIIVCTGHDQDRALMGELSAETLHFRGVKGYLCDGGVRDSDFILKLGFPVFSRYFTPRDVVGSWTPDVFGEPVTIGGVSINPGDYLIGDIDGTVIIPGAMAEDVISKVETVMKTENMVRTAILQGVDPKEAYLQHGRF
jgi:regulator of RNase E activity RraA